MHTKPVEFENKPEEILDEVDSGLISQFNSPYTSGGYACCSTSTQLKDAGETMRKNKTFGILRNQFALRCIKRQMNANRVDFRSIHCQRNEHYLPIIALATGYLQRFASSASHELFFPRNQRLDLRLHHQLHRGVSLQNRIPKRPGFPGFPIFHHIQTQKRGHSVVQQHRIHIPQNGVISPAVMNPHRLPHNRRLLRNPHLEVEISGIPADLQIAGSPPLSEADSRAVPVAVRRVVCA